MWSGCKNYFYKKKHLIFQSPAPICVIEFMRYTFGSNRGGTYTQSNQQHLLVSESE